MSRETRRDAVREALVEALETSVTWDKLGRVLGLEYNAAIEDYADALLSLARHGGAMSETQVMCGRCLKIVGNVPLEEGEGVHTCAPRNPLYAEAEGDDDNGDNVALQVICRVFDDWEPIYERWLAYDKSQWIWWGRALGGFLHTEVRALSAQSPAVARGVTEERAAWIDGACWASMDNDEISVQDIQNAADEKFGPEATPSDDQRFIWLESQTSPNHYVIVCALDLPHEKWASVQRVNQFHNPHKVEWCIEGETLRTAIDRAMREVPTLTLATDDQERDRSQAAPIAAPVSGEIEPVAWVPCERESGEMLWGEMRSTKADVERFLRSSPLYNADRYRPVPLYTHSAPSGGEADDWTPSNVEYDRAIHHNPDAKAWADLFVQTFPKLADKHDLMLGWFANAMMAMHDAMKSRESAAPRPETGDTRFGSGGGAK